MKEKVMRYLNKACIFTATLLVAVLVFFVGVSDITARAAERPVSSIDRIAGKLKDADKYYTFKNKNTNTDTEDNKETNTGSDTETETDKDIETGNDTEAEKDKDTETGNDTEAEKDKDTETGNDTENEKDNDSETGKDTDTGTENDDKASEINWNDNYTEAELRLMSGIIYCEAGSMSEPARIAVANVIINRVNSKTDWGHVNSIKEVIYDDKWGVQFSPIKGNPSSLDQAMEIYDNLEDYKGTWRYDQMKNCISSAKKAFCGEKAIPDSYMYFNGSIESSKKKCESKGRSYMIIDHHIYFE